MEDDSPSRITPVKVDDAIAQEALDREIKFIGEPIFRPPEGARDLTLPGPYRDHPLLKNRYFFTVPRELFNEVYRRVGPDAFDVQLARLECDLTGVCGDHSMNVGFWSNRPITHDVLQQSPLGAISPERAEALGWDKSEARLAQIERIYEERSGHFALFARGYAGWLMTNQQFLDEHDALLANWSDMVRRWGVDRLGLLIPKEMCLPESDPTEDPRWEKFDAAFEEFFVRWRLQGLAAPYLPVPLRPLMAGSFPVSIVRQIARAGGVFLFPDTFPVPSRDELRGLLHDALHQGEQADHLGTWMDIIRPDNPAKNPVARFARLFQLQHYWRLLLNRHAPAFRRKLTVAKEVMAWFCGTAFETVHQDLLFIKGRRGDDWIQRNPIGPFGPF